MCGITFCLKGLSPEQIKYHFDFFELFRENPSNNFSLGLTAQGYSEYIQEKNLYISDFSPRDIFETIGNRGPDYFGCVKLIIPLDESKQPKIEEILNDDLNFEKSFFETVNGSKNDEEKNLEILMAGAILHLRGDYNSPNPQPIIDKETYNSLLYNGEIFNIELSYLEVFEKLRKYEHILKIITDFDPFRNDTKQLFNILDSYSKFYHTESGQEKSMNYLEDMKLIIDCFNADFSFIFIDILNRKITFGKDIFGKRSLLLGIHQNGLCFSSCSIKPNACSKDLKEENLDDEEESKVEKEAKASDERDHNGLIKEEWKKNFLEKKYNNEYFMSLDKTWIEIPANKIYTATIINSETTFLQVMYINLSGWKYRITEEESKIEYENDSKLATNKVFALLQKSIKNLLQNIIGYKSFFLDNKQELNLLAENLENEKVTKSDLSILFSGGLDSALIALISSMVVPEGTR
jgi:asparagine synthetase B (glutamine-hydrolysing)